MVGRKRRSGPRLLAGLAGEFFLGELLGQGDLRGERLGGGLWRRLGVEAEEVPGLALVVPLADVPAALLILGEREQGARGGLVAVGVALGGPDLVQHAAL